MSGAHRLEARDLDVAAWFDRQAVRMAARDDERAAREGSEVLAEAFARASVHAAYGDLG